MSECDTRYGDIEVLRNTVGGGRVSAFLKKSITKMYGSSLLALRLTREWVGVDFPEKKRYVTFEWPLSEKLTHKVTDCESYRDGSTQDG